MSSLPYPRLPVLLEALYERYNDPRWLEPDPLVVVRRYSAPADQELAGLVASALALGNATLIMRAAETALAPFGADPSSTLASMDNDDVVSCLAGFRYRFFDSGDLAPLLCAARDIAGRYGSLENAFLAGIDTAEPDYAQAASCFVRNLSAAAPSPWRLNLLPDPARGSAAKRVFLYLRWMVRHDAVDPGPWRQADPARLLVPLDTHMAAACRRLGLIDRRSTDLKAAREAGAAFRAFRPDDPVRYDFCMTRPGIRPDLDPDQCFDCFH
ncbi:MAG: TIGR02757 family protein [Spirochaetes bacterium GWB1_59_5]|nr:MAG: TIGR02757 family protein [Spirochaetes bacterium GWB1_59_5]